MYQIKRLSSSLTPSAIPSTAATTSNWFLAASRAASASCGSRGLVRPSWLHLFASAARFTRLGRLLLQSAQPSSRQVIALATAQSIQRLAPLHCKLNGIGQNFISLAH